MIVKMFTVGGFATNCYVASCEQTNEAVVIDPGFCDNSEAEKIFRQERSRKLPQDIQKRALVKLLMIDASVCEEDLLIPPSNRFEHLKGSLKGYCSIRINDQWRIVFKFKNGDAYDVSIRDYH